MKTFTRTNLDSLLPPCSTCAVLYPYDRATNSVLMVDDPTLGLTGYIFQDLGNDITIKEKAMQNFRAYSNVIVVETNPLCPEVMQSVTGDQSNPQSTWKFVIIPQNFRTPPESEIVPRNMRWYHKNVIPWSRMLCNAEKEFLMEFMGVE